MKSVLISIRPQWCELIATGEKTLEVRKTMPKLETPFKCYIYCTKSKSNDGLFVLNPKCRSYYGISVICGNLKDNGDLGQGNGKVIGEFICDRIDSHTPDCLVVKEDAEKAVEGSCLKSKDLRAYIRGKRMEYNLYTLPDFYCWHISNLKIYDKPKALSEFTGFKKMKDGFELYRLDRPPQSWCYVEEV